ncbi:MAG: acetylornithine deacetylase [Pseudomonadota bacterium]
MHADLSACRETLADLVAFETISDRSNLDMIDYLADRLDHLGARVETHRDETGGKANLFATLGPDDAGGLVLSGHTDVVPVVGQAWTTDPFALTEHDGLLYGRGTCDMKGFIAACLVTAPRYVGARLTRPLHFAFTYDEEVGCFGAQALARTLSDQGVRPATAIIGEPTSMRVIEGHKGCHEYHTRFKGLAGHGSAPSRGVNAVEYAARYIARLIELQARLQDRAPADSRFVPPWSTINVGRIRGGSAANVIPEHAELDWDFRPVQDTDTAFVHDDLERYVNDVLRPAMRDVFDGADISTETIGAIDGLEPVPENAARDIVMALTGANKTDCVAFGTEAGIFQHLGMSAVVCGPGSIDQAHKADEFVALDQLSACLEMLDGLSHRMTR